MRTRALAAGVAVLLGASLSGCGLAADGALGTGEDFTVEGALEALPDVAEDRDDDADPVRLVVGDLGAVRGSTSSAKDEEYADWLRPVDRAGVGPLLPDNLRTEHLASGEVRTILGFDTRDVLAYASLEDPPSSLTVVSLADGEGPKDDVKATGKGEPGDPTQQTGALPPAFPFVLGIGRRTGEVALGQSADVLVDWANKGDTMAAEEDVLSLAKALDTKDVVAAELVDGEVEPLRATRAQLADADLVPGYDAVGVGQQVTEGGVRTWIAYATDDPDRFASAVRRQWREGGTLAGGRPLSDLARLDGVSTVDGTVLVELTPERPDLVLRMLRQAEAPFVTDPTED